MQRNERNTFVKYIREILLRNTSTQVRNTITREQLQSKYKRAIAAIALIRKSALCHCS